MGEGERIVSVHTALLFRSFKPSQFEYELSKCHPSTTASQPPILYLILPSSPRYMYFHSTVRFPSRVRAYSARQPLRRVAEQSQSPTENACQSMSHLRDDRALTHCIPYQRSFQYWSLQAPSYNAARQAA